METVDSRAESSVAGGGRAGTVSFVVPTRNSGRTLEACLLSLRAQDWPDVEIVVVDNASTDDTPEIARRCADAVFEDGPERSAQRNRGWRESAGELIVFVDSDMVLDREVARESVALFSADTTLGAAVLPEFSFGEGFLTTCRILEKDLSRGDAAAEGCRVFRRAAVAEVGGYDESSYAGEDWEFSDAVVERGWARTRLAAGVHHDEGRISVVELFRKKVYYGRNLSRYLSSPRVNRRPVFRPALVNPRGLASRPAQGAGLLFLKTVELAGLSTGILAAKAAEYRRGGKGAGRT